METLIPRLLVLSLGLAIPASAATKIRVDSVPPEYTPTAGAELPEPVSMEGYRFEVNKQLTRVRVVVEYTYPDESVFGTEGGIGPRTTYAQIPGLVFDRSSHAVVYRKDGHSTVCAVPRRWNFPTKGRLDFKNTGFCAVKAQLADHVASDGWATHRFRTIDTYFVVHESQGLMY